MQLRECLPLSITYLYVTYWGPRIEKESSNWIQAHRGSWAWLCILYVHLIASKLTENGGPRKALWIVILGSGPSSRRFGSSYQVIRCAARVKYDGSYALLAWDPRYSQFCLSQALVEPSPPQPRPLLLTRPHAPFSPGQGTLVNMNVNGGADLVHDHKTRAPRQHVANVRRVVLKLEREIGKLQNRFS